MQPKIINKGKRFITGLSGNGTDTGKVWNDFDNRFKTKSFVKADDFGYEIRFWQSRKTGKIPDSEKNVHVGFLTERTLNADGFSTIELPTTEYAVFDVFVAKGYDSRNEEMENWIADNSTIYGVREFGGFEYVIECYNEKFKDGSQPDSIVEIWIPIIKI